MNYERTNLRMKTTRGFTLLEVLIATAIFAVAMVLAGGVVAQTVRYQNKIGNVRLVVGESQRLSDLISADIKLANAAGTVTSKVGPGNHYGEYDYKNGLALFNCGAECRPVHFRKKSGLGNDDNPSAYNDSDTDDYKANTLVIFYTNRTTNATNYKIYYAKNFKLYLYSGVGANVQFSTSGGTGDLDGMITSLATQISSVNTSDTINFGGFAPYDNNDPAENYFYQPYILFNIAVETLNYSTTTEVGAKAKTEIRTGVAGRSYNL